MPGQVRPSISRTRTGKAATGMDAVNSFLTGDRHALDVDC